MPYCFLVEFTVTDLAQKIDALLPQTQCKQCGYDGCMPYADAIATGNTEINRCPPGGDAGIQTLAALLSRAVIPLDGALRPHVPHRIAVIDEARCIGCAKCLAPCPTDAIIGASKFMHSVIASVCTGCELCIPPCPVDCIRMEENPAYPAMLNPDIARERHRFHLFRLQRVALERETLLAERERAVMVAAPDPT